jgi:glutamine synthetase
VVETLKKRSLKNMLMDSTCLTSDALMRDTLLSPTFEARPHADEPKDSILHNEETSALHINVSLCDKQGRNLFAMSDKLLDHCVRSLVALQNDAALPMLPSEDSLKRINANRSAPAAIGVKTGKYFQGSRHTSVTVRRFMLEGDDYTPVAENTRIENRLPGADADPFVSMAITMAAMVDAVRQHVHKVEDKAHHKINLRIDDIPAEKYPQHDLPKTHEELVEKFASTARNGAARMRKLLGDTLYDAILAEYGSERSKTR